MSLLQKAENLQEVEGVRKALGLQARAEGWCLCVSGWVGRPDALLCEVFVNRL